MTEDTQLEPISGADQAAVLEQVVVYGDLARLTPAQRVTYYRKVCETLGLNPFTKPFMYITLNGKLTLYPTRDATDQLRKLNSISISGTEHHLDVETHIYSVVASGQDRHGRLDQALGAVSIEGLRGENLANAYMKAETKAKRRLTLSLAGLGMLDEDEVAATDAVAVAVDDNGNLPATEAGRTVTAQLTDHLAALSAAQPIEQPQEETTRKGTPEPVKPAVPDAQPEPSGTAPAAVAKRSTGIPQSKLIEAPVATAVATIEPVLEGVTVITPEGTTTGTVNSDDSITVDQPPVTTVTSDGEADRSYRREELSAAMAERHVSLDVLLEYSKLVGIGPGAVATHEQMDKLIDAVRVHGLPEPDPEAAAAAQAAEADAAMQAVLDLTGGAEVVNAPLGKCPVHSKAWRAVPSGVNKETKRPYSAFWACAQFGCKERPPAEWVQSHDVEAALAR